MVSEKQKKLRLLTLFAGYGTDNFALKALGIDYELIGYSDINKYANQCFKQNHCPDDVEDKLRLGDVTKVDEKTLPDFDLLTGGFPCQSFSSAGKGLGINDTRGTLFHDIIRIAEYKKPKFIFLENVKGLTTIKHQDTYETIMSELERIGYVVYNRVLNTKDFGIPQSRDRIWFVCFRMDVWKENNNFQWPEKEKLKLFLKNILEDDIDPKYYLSTKAIKGILKSNYSERQPQTNNVCGTLKCGGDVKCIYVADFRNDEGLRIRKNGLSPCLSASKNSETEPSRMPPFIVASRSFPRNCSNEEERKQQLEPRHDGTTNTISTVQKDNYVLQIKNATNKGFLEAKPGDGINLEQPDSLTRRGRVQNQISPTLQTGDQRGVITDDLTIRKLTPRECFRLQGFIDDEINLKDLSNTQQYKLAGNGQSVNVVTKIFEQMFR